jgi:hypothetical protein
MIARKRDGRVRLFTLNGFDWTVSVVATPPSCDISDRRL